MDLNRSLTKKQARLLINGKTIVLFLITIIMTIIMCFSLFSTGAYDTYDYYENDDGFSINGNNPIENFGTDNFDKNYFDGINSNILPVANNHFHNVSYKNSLPDSLAIIIWVLLLSMNMGIASLYIRVIKNQYQGFGKEFSNAFKVSFDKHYFKKVGAMLVKYLLIYLWSLLFIIPGIVEYYKLYFVEYILAEYPGLTISQAKNLSKTLTNGHKGELFKMDLSFIGWGLLTIMTCGIVGIYAVPYIFTTRALYYENFKIRCKQELKISDLDFMTDEERIAMYSSQNNGYGFNNGYNYNAYQQSQNNYGYSNQTNNSYNYVNNDGTNNSYNPNYSQNAQNTPFQSNQAQTIDNTTINNTDANMGEKNVSYDANAQAVIDDSDIKDIFNTSD